MRKYKQLLLLIVTVASLSLLLIYRHEYYRLRNVLEVFHFFGKPPDCNYSDLVFTNNLVPQFDWGQSPFWRSVEDVQVYSAFWLDGQSEAKAIAVGGELVDSRLSCYLWYEERRAHVIGSFRSARIDIDKQRKFVLYFYYCSASQSSQEQPYAVSFSLKNKRPSNLEKIPLFLGPKVQLNETIACVAPSAYSKRSLAEFLSYYKVLGVDRFILYDSNAPFRIATIIQNLSPKLGFRLTNFLWNNYDLGPELTRRIVTEDCLLRTSNRIRNILVVDQSEFLVPKQYYSIPQFLDELNPARDWHRISVEVLRFCIVQTDPQEPLVVQNTLQEVDGSADFLLIYRGDLTEDEASAVVESQAVTQDVAVANRYLECASRHAKTRRDYSILKYASGLKMSTLIRLLKHNKL